MNPRRVMVLGAGGFIGRHLTRRLAACGSEVIAAMRAPGAIMEDGIQTLIAPFDDVSHFIDQVSRCDVVIHSASSSTPGSSAAKPQLEGNLRTTLALVEALQDNPSCRLLFLSSGGTLYGDCSAPATESDPLRPRSYHGAGKAAAEHFIHAWASQYGGTAVVLRPSNVYGPGQHARSGFGIIPAAFDAALHGTPLTVWGDGSMARDYLFIGDLVALCLASLDHPCVPGTHVYNAGSGHAVGLETLLDHIDGVTGRPVRRDLEPARRVDIQRIATNADAAHKAFGWSPAVPLDEGLRRTWQWFSTRR